MKPIAFVAALLCLQSAFAAEPGALYPPDKEYFAMMDKVSKPNQWEYRVTEDGTVFRVTPTPATEGPDIDYVRVWRQGRLKQGIDPSRCRRYVFSSNPVAKKRTGNVPGPTEKATDTPKAPEGDSSQDAPGNEKDAGATSPASAASAVQQNEVETQTWAYNITRDGRVGRISPTPGTEGPDIEWVRKVWYDPYKSGKQQFVPMISFPSPKGREPWNVRGDIMKPPAGTPEKDKEEAKTPDKGREDDKKAGGSPEEKKEEQKDPDWPPKEVAPAAATNWEPTEAEFEQARKLKAEAKNSGESSKSSEAYRVLHDMVLRLAKPGEKLPTSEWGKRLDALNKINKVARELGYVEFGRDVVQVLADDIASEDKHPAMFAKLKWTFDNQRKYGISSRYLRTATYKYIESHADAFKDAAAKKLFCQQLIKGGISDPEIKELSESYK